MWSEFLRSKLKIFLICCTIVLSTAQVHADSKCVQIYYDHSDPYEAGHSFALMLANLIGHFPNYQRTVIPIEMYKKNDLEKCQANFYLGTNYDASIPLDFTKDFKKTKKKVVWMGYGFWNVPNIEDEFGIKFDGHSKIDENHKDQDGIPGFFRDVIYKGQTFVKAAELDNDQKLKAAFEIARFLQVNTSKSKVLARTQHSTTNEILPWALQNKNKYLFSEVPLSYISESDRYLILADLLFDILDEKPQHTKKIAVIRIEDVHPMIDLRLLDRAVKILNSEKVIPSLSLIPIFRDPLKNFPSAGGVTEVDMDHSPEFLQQIQKYKKSGATLIWHGVTHQYNDIPNPTSGTSGVDFEFWDANNQSPIAEDSSNYILDKLQVGALVLHDSQVDSKIWLTPHYLASPLDHVIFGSVFTWVMGRMSYFPYSADNIPDYRLLENLRYNHVTSEDQSNRLALFKGLTVRIKNNNASNQLFPYEIFGDYYHQRVIPENLGNYQPEFNRVVINKRNIDQVLADAQRNTVIRDSWASVFYHSYLLETESANDKETSLYKLITGIKKLGFEFINLEKFVSQELPNRKTEIMDIEYKAP